MRQRTHSFRTEKQGSERIPSNRRKSVEVNSVDSLPLDELPKCIESWLLDCEIRQCSKATLTNRRGALNKLLWYIKQEKITTCDTLAIRKFLRYAGDPQAPRWETGVTGPVKAGTIASYHRIFRAWFNWLVKEGTLTKSPMCAITAPLDRPDDILPFTQEQVETLLHATTNTDYPLRDKVILLLLLDTGLRASELVSLKYGDVNTQEHSLRVEGKGGKARSVWFGSRTTRAIWDYLRSEPRKKTDPLFWSERHRESGPSLTRSGLSQLFRRLKKATGINAVRCSPHTCRNTFAVNFLRNGGDQFTLMRILGHTDVKMTSRYVSFVNADLARSSRLNSPMDRMLDKN